MLQGWRQYRITWLDHVAGMELRGEDCLLVHHQPLPDPVHRLRERGPGPEIQQVFSSIHTLLEITMPAVSAKLCFIPPSLEKKVADFRETFTGPKNSNFFYIFLVTEICMQIFCSNFFNSVLLFDKASFQILYSAHCNSKPLGFFYLVPFLK